MHRLLVLVLVVGLCAGLCGAAAAQEITGTIAGSVLDKTGAGVPNAAVTVTNTDQNIVIRTLQATDRGEYVASFLPVGHYAVTAEAKGFKKTTHTGIVLNVSDKLAVNFNLEV